MITNPITYVKLIHTEFTTEHQLTFPTKQDQYTFFENLSGMVLYENDFTYQRKDNIIRYPRFLWRFRKIQLCNV